MSLQSGNLYYWRFRDQKEWRFGYCTFIGPLIRMGAYAGDLTGGKVVSQEDIEWKELNQ